MTPGGRALEVEVKNTPNYPKALPKTPFRTGAASLLPSRPWRGTRLNPHSLQNLAFTGFWVPHREQQRNLRRQGPRVGPHHVEHFRKDGCCCEA